MRHRKNSVVLSGMLTTVLLLHGGPAGAQSGGLDPSFGTDGTVTLHGPHQFQEQGFAVLCDALR